MDVKRPTITCMFRERAGHTRISFPRRGDGSGWASSPGRHGRSGLPDGNDEDASRGWSRLCDVLWGNVTARKGWRGVLFSEAATGKGDGVHRSAWLDRGNFYKRSVDFLKIDCSQLPGARSC